MGSALFKHDFIVRHTLLVVMYKMKLASSPTIQSIVAFIGQEKAVKNANFRLFIWDNSPNLSDGMNILREQVPHLDIEYIHTPENISLSKIYNEVASKLDENEYLTLLDQDTILPVKYFWELEKAQMNGYPLILPQVKSSGILVSPGRRFFCKGKLIENIKPGVTDSKNLLAINSGMSATEKVFKKIRYDERLMFYGTDTYFMKNYEKHFRHTYVLDVELNHSLAEQDEATSVEHREKIRKARHDAWEIVFSETLLERLFLWGYQRMLRLRSWLR